MCTFFNPKIKMQNSTENSKSEIRISKRIYLKSQKSNLKMQNDNSEFKENFNRCLPRVSNTCPTATSEAN